MTIANIEILVDIPDLPGLGVRSRVERETNIPRHSHRHSNGIADKSSQVRRPGWARGLNGKRRLPALVGETVHRVVVKIVGDLLPVSI